MSQIASIINHNTAFSRVPATKMNAYISKLLNEFHHDPNNLLQVLIRVQDRYSHVSNENQEHVAVGLGIPRTQVAGVVQFYAFLSDRPRGTYHILLSNNITDLMLGKRSLMDQLCRELGVQPGQPRVDGRVTVDSTSCTGMSDQGPAALVNGYAITRLTPERVSAIVNRVEGLVPMREWPDAFFEVKTNIHRSDILLDRDYPAGAALKTIVLRGDDAIMDELHRSGLRGMGGAGFETARKWAFCRNASDHERYVVCNADEGEPGTFKDRVLLQNYADLLFEGMTLCARLIGSHKGYLYLRGEYRYLLASLQDTLNRRRNSGLLGRSILDVDGFDFDVEIHLGAGAYVCGEESALIESLEGKRAIPRIRPPFPVTHGLHYKPTVVNNVETFCTAAKIAMHGGEWFAGIGSHHSKGTKLLSISGDCSKPGVYEYPFGVPLRKILDDCGAGDTQAVQIGGAAGHCIPEREFERQISFEDLSTGGSFMIFNKERNLLDVVHNFAEFFAHESCGFCTPCRIGTSLMKDLIEKLTAGHATHLDLKEMRQLANIMRNTSNCGLGITAPTVVTDTLKKFPEVYEQRLNVKGFEPAFDLDSSLEDARRITGREDPDAHIQ